MVLKRGLKATLTSYCNRRVAGLDEDTQNNDHKAYLVEVEMEVCSLEEPESRGNIMEASVEDLDNMA